MKFEKRFVSILSVASRYEKRRLKFEGIQQRRARERNLIIVTSGTIESCSPRRRREYDVFGICLRPSEMRLLKWKRSFPTTKTKIWIRENENGRIGDHQKRLHLDSKLLRETL